MGPYLSQPITKKDNAEGVGQVGSIKLPWSSAAMQGWRNTMEDAHLHYTNIDGTDVSLFGIFDGHGGAEVAKFVEKHFVDELKANTHFKSKNYRQALEDTFYKMDELLESKEGQVELNQIKKQTSNSGDNERSYAGCTANVILFANETLWCANAGDARSILCQGKGKALPLSTDHKPLQDTERNRIVKAGGSVNADGRVNGNLNLSRAIGDLEYKAQKDRKRDEQLIIATPDIMEIKINKDSDEFILMGCDGIWETMTNEQIADFCRESLVDRSITVTVNDLLDRILAKDTREGVGCDNMSAILIKLK